MTKVLITGATGNVGSEVLNALNRIDHQLDIYAGVRDINAAQSEMNNTNIGLLPFDITNSKTVESALQGIDILYLVRPPQLSDVKKYFQPLINTCHEKGVKHIVFLSVQGVENSKTIPHHKIEKLIADSKINYTFLRPAYFMQNFTTTLRADLVLKKQIYLPAGDARFTLVDVRDIGEVSAIILTEISKHVNKSYELTGNEKLTFGEMKQLLSQGLGVDLQFKSPNLFSFFFTKRKEKMPTMFILVMIMLHYLPRFQKAPETTHWIEAITHKKPTTFEKFIIDNKAVLTTPDFFTAG